jgi:hypothetical protein
MEAWQNRLLTTYCTRQVSSLFFVTRNYTDKQHTYPRKMNKTLVSYTAYPISDPIKDPPIQDSLMQRLPLNQFTRPGDMDSTHDTFTHCPAPHFQDTHKSRYTVLNTVLPCIHTSYILHASLPCTRRKGIAHASPVGKTIPHKS